MASVHTDLGPGQVVETKTTRGRTEYRVAGNGFDMWFDGTKLGFAPVDESNSVTLPYDPQPQYGVGSLTDSTIQPIHEIDADERTSPADSLTFDNRERDEGDKRGTPGPNPDLFAKSSAIGDPTPHQSGSYGLDWDAPERSYGNDGYGPSEDYGTDEYGAGRNSEGHTIGDQLGLDPHEYNQMQQDDDAFDGGRMQQIHEQSPHSFGRSVEDASADAHQFGGEGGMGPLPGPGSQASPYDFPISGAGSGRGDDPEAPWNRQSYRQADVLEGAPTRFSPDFIVNDTDDEHFQERLDVEEDDRETTDPEGIVHFSSMVHEANPLAIAIPALAEAAGIGGGAAAAGEGAAAAGEAGGMAQGLGQAGQAADAIGQANDALQRFDNHGNPLPLPDLGQGWGSLTGNVHEAWSLEHPVDSEGGYPVQSSHEWLAEHPEPEPDYSEWGWQRGPRPAGLDDRYADIIAAHDPYDKVAQFRHDPEAFINRVGHCEYEGLHPRMGQYMDMVEGDEQLRTAAWKDVRAKAMRLRREGRVHVKDVGDDRIYASVEGDHGTYDTMIKKGGAFSGFGGGHSISNWHCACEWGKWAFQRRYTYIGRLCSHGYAAYMEMQSAHMKGKKRTTKYPKVKRSNNIRTADDQTTQDWKIDDTGKAKGALDELRNWAETPQEEDLGNMEDRVEDIRDAVDRAREEGVDADQLVASLRRHAAPEDEQEWGSPWGAPSPGFQMRDFNPASGEGGKGPGVVSGPSSLDDSAGNLKADNPGAPGGPSGGAWDAKTTAPGGGGGSPGMQWGGGNAGGDSWGSSPTHTVQPGDTLSDITQSRGGGDYNNITNVGGGEIGNKDLINPGQKLDLSGVGGGSSASGAGADVGTALGGSPTTTNAPGGGLGSALGGGSDTSSSGGGSSWFGSGTSSDKNTGKTSRTAAPVEDPNNPGAAPAANPANPAGTGGVPPQPGTGVPPVPPVPGAPGAPGEVPHAGTGAPPGPVGDAVNAPAQQVTNPDDPSATSDTGDGTDVAGGTSDTGSGSSDIGMSGIGDMGSMVGDIGSMVGQGVDMASDIAGAIGGIFGARQLQADRDWFEAAYPDVKYREHQPFNGSGGWNVEEWGQSKDNIKEHHTDNIEDVTDEPKKTFLKDTGSMDDLKIEARRGITRAGSGPKRAPVTPEIVRQQRVNHPGMQMEAAAGDFVDDDPYSKTAADFGAGDGGDVVAQFQRQADAGGSAITAPAGSGGQYDDFTASPVFQQVAARMQRTAGRNYSLADQAALVREGDIGGAGNLDSLDLKGTHYEAMESVGLW